MQARRILCESNIIIKYINNERTYLLVTMYEEMYIKEHSATMYAYRTMNCDLIILSLGIHRYQQNKSRPCHSSLVGTLLSK